tara:strand:- start:288 stop:485 length:198 start_codon:yes stop_codon:yes gene_type:complete
MLDILVDMFTWVIAILLFIPIAASEVTGISTKTIYGTGIVGSMARGYMKKKAVKTKKKDIFYEDA